MKEKNEIREVALEMREKLRVINVLIAEKIAKENMSPRWGVDQFDAINHIENALKKLYMDN